LYIYIWRYRYMPQRKVDASVKAEAIARMGKGESADKIAKSLGVTRQSIYNWVNHANGPVDAVPPPGSSAAAVQPGTPKVKSVVNNPGAATKPVVGGGWGGAGVVAAPATVPTVSDAEFCADTIGGMKKTVGNIGCLIVGLDPTEKRINEHLELTPFAEETIKTNAHLIAPELRKHISGIGMVYVAIAVDLVVSGMGIVAIYKEKYPPKPKAKPEVSLTGDVKGDSL
jgi:hypothetical protein